MYHKTPALLRRNCLTMCTELKDVERTFSCVKAESLAVDGDVSDIIT